ncbi:MAG: hypothetical protein FD147_1620 [Chloroflexi bacterium]|nr:MAG: hypothetical protein FD147_1620 [Chloroflexota bacterium]
MRFRQFIVMGVSIIGLFFLMGCSVIKAFSPIQTPTQTSEPTSTPAPTLTPTLTPTPTEIPFYIDATVWSGDLKVPILIYHRFVPDSVEKSTATKMRYTDFSNQLRTLYNNDFSLISLKDWINGTFVLPAGKKPLIITLDDLWFADQLYLNEDGTPSTYSGIGILWEFSKVHPDFGFSASVFSNMGDKKTADKHVDDWFFVSEDDSWINKLALTIAWAIENGVDPYNHLFLHPKLDLTANTDIIYHIKENDRVIRYYLSRIGREDLIPRLGNIIALPYGIWPATTAGVNIIKNYKDPEGKPVQAVMEAYNLDAAQLTSSVFTPGFDPYHIARITASDYMIKFIIEHKAEIPSSTSCKLGPLQEEQSSDLEVIQRLIQNSVTNQSCPEGVYNVNGAVFVAKEGTVALFKEKDAVATSATPTLTPTLKP